MLCLTQREQWKVDVIQQRACASNFKEWRAFCMLSIPLENSGCMRKGSAVILIVKGGN